MGNVEQIKGLVTRARGELYETHMLLNRNYDALQQAHESRFYGGDNTLTDIEQDIERGVRTIERLLDVAEDNRMQELLQGDYSQAIEAARTKVAAWVNNPEFKRRMSERLMELGATPLDIEAAWQEVQQRPQTEIHIDPRNKGEMALASARDQTRAGAYHPYGGGGTITMMRHTDIPPSQILEHELRHAVSDAPSAAPFPAVQQRQIGDRWPKDAMSIAAIFEPELTAVVDWMPPGKLDMPGFMHHEWPSEAAKNKTRKNIVKYIDNIKGLDAKDRQDLKRSLRTDDPDWFENKFEYLSSLDEQYVSLAALRQDMVERRKGVSDPYAPMDRKTLDKYLAQPYDDLPHDVQRMLPLWTPRTRNALVEAFNKVSAFLLMGGAATDEANEDY
jgi:hypothetical protein